MNVVAMVSEKIQFLLGLCELWTALGSMMHRTVLMLGRRDADASLWSAMLWVVPHVHGRPIREEFVRLVSLPCSGTLATPSIALHPMLYHSRLYIPVIKSIGYK